MWSGSILKQLINLSSTKTEYLYLLATQYEGLFSWRIFPGYPKHFQRLAPSNEGAISHHCKVGPLGDLLGF